MVTILYHVLNLAIFKEYKTDINREKPSDKLGEKSKQEEAIKTIKLERAAQKELRDLPEHIQRDIGFENGEVLHIFGDEYRVNLN